MGRLLSATEATQHLPRLPPELWRLANVSESAKKRQYLPLRELGRGRCFPYYQE